MLLKLFSAALLSRLLLTAFFLYSGWFTEGLCGIAKFLGDGRKYNGSYLVICGNCGDQYLIDQYGKTATVFVLSL